LGGESAPLLWLRAALCSGRPRGVCAHPQSFAFNGIAAQLSSAFVVRWSVAAAMNNVGVIDTFLNTFTTYIDSGFGLVKGDVGFLSSTLIVIDITLAGLFWAWGADEDVMQRLIKKTLYIAFFTFVIGNFNNLAGVVFNSFAGLGLKAGGSSLSTTSFVQPGRIAQVGLDAGQPLLDAASQMMGFTSFFANFVQIAVLMVS
jgi:type IV secretion system protein TrbL